MNTPFSIFKNSFTDKIKKKMNYVNINKKYKIHKNKNNYLYRSGIFGIKNKLFEK